MQNRKFKILLCIILVAFLPTRSHGGEIEQADKAKFESLLVSLKKNPKDSLTRSSVIHQAALDQPAVFVPPTMLVTKLQATSRFA
jgi:hypothetical protein